MYIHSNYLVIKVQLIRTLHNIVTELYGIWFGYFYTLSTTGDGWNEDKQHIVVFNGWFYKIHKTERERTFESDS